MTHPVLAAHPRWKEHEARVADLHTRQQTIRAQVLAAQALAAEQKAAHNEALAEVARTGGTVPADPPPMPTGYDQTLQMLQIEADELRGQGVALMAEIAPELEESTRDRNQATMAQVAKAGQSLEKMRDEVHANLQFVAQVRGYVDQANPGNVVRPSRAARTRPRLTFDELLAFAEFDVDPLEPEPMPSQTGRIMKDDGTDQPIAEMRRRALTVQTPTSTLGLQHPSPLGRQEASPLGLQVKSDKVGAFGGEREKKTI